MFRSKKKQKNNIDKDFQDQVKDVKNLLIQGKTLLENNDLDEALNMLNKATAKASSIQVANSYLLYYYRGTCYLKMGNLEKAERDFIQSSSLADEKGKVQVYNALGNCKIKMAEEDPSYLEESVKCFEKAIQCSKGTDGQSYLNLANIYRKLNNNYQAVQEYTNAIKLLKSTQLYEALTKRGLCYREIGDIQNSIQDFNKALQICGEDPFAHFNLGINYLMCDKSELAGQKFDHAIEYSEQQPQYHNYKGLSLYMSGEYQQCISIYEYTLKLYTEKGINSSQVAQCWYNLGNTYYKLSNQQQAIKAFQNARKYPTPEELLLKIGYSEGLVYEMNHDILAVAKFRSCQSLLSANTSHQLYESTLYHLGLNLRQHKKYQAAIEVFTTLIDQGCEQQCIYQMRGKAYLDAQMYEQALKDFTFIQGINPNYSEVYYYLGMCKSNLSEIDASIADFFKAFELGSRNTCILNGISCAYLKSGKPGKSLVYANMALEKDSNKEQFLIQRSMVYIELGEYTKAIQDLTQATGVNSQNPFSYYQRGVVYYKNSQFKSAIKDLKKSFDYAPNKLIEPDIYYLIGICHSSLEQFDQAVQPFTRAIILRPQPKYYHQRAKCYLLLDKNLQALNDLNQVISEQPENAFAYFRRAFAFKALKKYEESADDFMKTRQLSPDDPRLIVNKKQIYSMKYRKLCEAGEQQ